jgi:hypothetical protein
MSDDLFRIFMILAIIAVILMIILITYHFIKDCFYKNRNISVEDSRQEPLLQDNSYYTSL